jgi:hypothetical protein
MKMDWDLVEQMIEAMLNEHMRTWETYDYFIVNDDTVLVKVYDESKKLMFTVKAKLRNDKLEVFEVS